MASNSGWSKGLPSGSSSLAVGDNDIRSNNSVLQAAWEEEHYFTDGSATSAGIHKKGSARAYVDVISNLSNPTADNDGRLYYATDTSQMFVCDFSNTTWQVFADNITLSSAQTWSGLQEFTTSPLGGSGNTLGPTRYNVYFSRVNVTSGSSLAASRFGTVAAHEYTNAFPLPRAGSVTGIHVVYNENITAGSFEVNPSFNGDPSTASITVNSSSISRLGGGAGHMAWSTFSMGVHNFSAGSFIQCYVAGDGSLSPSGTGDVGNITVELTFGDE